MNIKPVANAVALVLSAALAPAWGQVSEDTGERENYVLNPAGQTLVVVQPSDDMASIVRRAGGVDSPLMSFGDAVTGGTVEGIGSNPHMNAAGVAAWQIELSSSSTDSGIYTGTPGAVTEIASTGTTISGEDICSIEPFPLVNATGQVFFGSTVEGGPAQDTCNEDGDDFSAPFNGRKGIFRFTPPSTTTLLLTADNDGLNSPDTVLVSDPAFVNAATTFTITDAHLIAWGGDAVTSSGAALVTAKLDSTPGGSANRDDYDEARALLFLSGGGVSLVAMNDRDDNGVIQPWAAAGAAFGQVGKGVANASGLVLFKGQDANATDAPASLNTWTQGGGMVPLVTTGDPIPGSSGTFDGFAPHFDLNSSGGAAFTAGLSIDASCDQMDLAGFGAGDQANACRGVYFASGGSITEAARDTTAAAAAAGVGASDDGAGFTFQEIGSVAVANDNGRVLFVASNLQVDPICGDPRTNPNGILGIGGDTNTRNDLTGIFSWSAGAITKVIAEGDVTAPGMQVLRLFTPMPEMRQHDGGAGFAVRTWLDTDADCIADTEALIGPVAGVPGVSIPIPIFGSGGAFLLFGLLAIGGGLVLMRRG